MNKGNVLLDNILKLNNFILMAKSSNALFLYVDKILNGKCSKIKFIPEYDYVSLEVVLNALMLPVEVIDKETYQKLDKKELNYYLNKILKINNIRNNKKLNDKEKLLDFIVNGIKKGEFTCNNNSTITISTLLTLDSSWVLELLSFLNDNIYYNLNLSKDKKSYQFNLLNYSNTKKLVYNDFLNDLMLYKCKISKKNNSVLGFKDLIKIDDIIRTIYKYDFKKLEDINSELNKEGLKLSINKEKVKGTKDIENIFNECDTESKFKDLINFIKDYYDVIDSVNNVNIKNNKTVYGYLKKLNYAYFSNYSLNEARKLYKIDNSIKKYQTFINFFIFYIYDYDNIEDHFNYELLKLEDLRPKIVDYETEEYKNIIDKLSNLSKRQVSLNKKVNKYMTSDIRDYKVINYYGELLSQVNDEIVNLKSEFAARKENNNSLYNINKIKINYIIDSILNNNYVLFEDKIIFREYDKKDNHVTFYLVIKLEDFNDEVLSLYNQNERINYYQV